MTQDAHTQTAMNNMYRWTRHIYDASRKYYLLGRDTLIQNLNAKADNHICEVGCGTARNLIKMAQRYPDSYFYGLDASDEMLKTARTSLVKAGLNHETPVEQGLSQNFDPQKLFGLKNTLNTIVFSYALSIIPPWKASIDHALSLLPKGGEIHIVDFGGQEDLPKVFRAFLFWWLSLFHVYYKPEILDYLKMLEKEGKIELTLNMLYGGYAYHAVLKKV